MNKHLNVEDVDKPWGNYHRFTLNYPSTVKVLTIIPNGILSLQTHEHRDEFWRILPGGTAVVEIDDEVKDGNPGDEFYIPRGSKHRISAKDENVYFLEIAFGEFDEMDIERLEDKYGR